MGGGFAHTVYNGWIEQRRNHDTLRPDKTARHLHREGVLEFDLLLLLYGLETLLMYLLALLLLPKHARMSQMGKIIERSFYLACAVFNEIMSSFSH